ncbi:unnamed protein product [Schistosoma rodhaini]|uniref:C2H2-type domain-containing protein n=1 Tax=Schistosoma rodhaini TaxID=6188 RepID=A0AA85EYX1_9TREM|nr:unnamed protein product [Schistosoma rodhaini]
MQMADSNCVDSPPTPNYVYTLNEVTDVQSDFVPLKMASQVDTQNYASDELSATYTGLRCSICHCFFNSSDQMSRHLNIHNTGKPYVCSHCNASFNQAENLYVHISLYHTMCENQDHYNCCLCDKRFLRFTAYKSHLLLHQIDENFVCSVCQQSFESVTLYEKHLHACTKTIVINKPPSQYRCRICGMLLSSIGKIKQHYRRRHPCYRSHSIENPGVITEANLEPSTDINAGNIRSSKLRATDHLSTIIKRGQRRSKNSLSMLDQLIYQIPVEQPVIQDNSHAIKSNRKKRKTPYLCSVCHKKFVKPSLLKRHMTIHTKNKSYECVLCHATFTQKSSAKTHVLLHISALNLHPDYHSTENGTDSSLPILTVNNESQDSVANRLPSLDSHVNSGIQFLTFPNDNDTLNCTTLPHNSVVLQSFIPQYHAAENNLNGIRTDHADHNLVPPVSNSNLGMDYSYPQMFSCPVCYKRFQLSRSLRVHMLRHSMVGCKSYERIPISQNSIQQKNMRNRLNTKISDKSKKSCSRKLVHRFNRCIHCFKAFRSVNRLKLHIYKTHLGRCTIFMCRKCPRRFISSMGLKRHVNLRHRCIKSNNICPICQTLFLNLSALKRHMDIHSSERLFSCYICHKRFQFLHSCRKHLLNHSITKRSKKQKHNVQKLSESCASDMVTIPKYPVLQTVIIDSLSKSRDAGSCSDPNVTVGDFINTVEKCSLYNNTGPNTFRSDGLSVVVHVQSPSNNPSNIFVPLPKSVSQHQNFDFPTVNNFRDNLDNLKNSEMISIAAKPYSEFSQNQTDIWIDSSAENQSYCVPNIPPNEVDQTLDLLVIDGSQAFSSTEVPVEGSLDAYQEPVLLAPDNVDSSKFPSNLNIDPLLNTQSFMCAVEPLEKDLTTNICYASNTYTTNINTAVSVVNDSNQASNTNPVYKPPRPSEKAGLNVHKSFSFQKETSDIIESNSFPILSTQQLYGCGLCNMVYEDAESLLQHNRISHNNVSKSFSCSSCPRSFTNPTLLLSHSRIHSPEYDGILNCPLCPMSIFTKQSALSRHIIYCHPLPLSEPFMCSNCGMRFMMLRSLKSHVNNILNGVDICVSKSTLEQQESTNNMINNELRNGKNTSKLNNTHNLKRNTHQISSLSSNLVDEIAKLQPSNHLSLSEKYLIKAARERVENTVSFPKLLIDSHSVNHQSNFPVSGSICNICNKNFTKKSDLRYHLNVHFGIRPYECDKCHRRFMKHSQLRQHKFKVHESNMSKIVLTSKKKALMKHALFCHLCGSGFSCRSSLRLHVRLHTGTRGYGCPYCNSVFHNPSHRKRHLLKCKAKHQSNDELTPANFSSTLDNNIFSHDVMNINHPEEETIREAQKMCRSFKDCICDNGVSEHCTKCTLYLDILLYSKEISTNDKVINNQVLDVPNSINNSGSEPVNISTAYLEITDHDINNNPEKPFTSHNISNTIDVANGQQCHFLLASTCGMTELNQHFIPVNNNVDNVINIHDSNNDINNDTNSVVLYSDENIFDFVPCEDIYSNNTLHNNPEYLNTALENEPMSSSTNNITTDNAIISTHIHDDDNNLTTHLTKNTTIMKAKSNIKYSYNKKFQRLFNCTICHKTFTKNSSLIRHERIHNRIKPFVCHYCGASFTQSYSLTSHELIHIGEKPYKCSQCNASFRQSCNLKRHLKLVHKNKCIL